MANETPDQPVILDPQEDQSAQNPAVEPSEVSPAPQPDYAAEIAALKSQFDREKDRNDLLEQSLRIQERFLNRPDPAPQRSAPEEQQWTQELEVLEKALDPILSKQRKQFEPLAQGYMAAMDEIDAMKFNAFLQRNNPEVLDNEDEYARTMQQVDTVMQTARQRGMNITRIDAFVFNEGLKGTKDKVVQRKQIRGTAKTAELKREAEVRVASGTSTSGEPRVTGNAGIQTIRAKANRGERLNQEERNKLRDFVSNIEL